MVKTKQKYLDSSKKWKEDNKERVKATSNAWRKKNREKLIEYGRINRDLNDFGGNRQKALERDNFECQECGMSQEEHFILFNKGLNVDHIDGKGRYSEVKNNELSNLKTLCFRCHGKKDGPRCEKDVWGKLKEKDNSIWKYPKIKKEVTKRVKRLGTIGRAKQDLAEELGVSFWTIDNMCYDRKKLSDALGVKDHE